MRWRSRGLAYCIEKVSDIQGRAFERGLFGCNSDTDAHSAPSGEREDVRDGVHLGAILGSDERPGAVEAISSADEGVTVTLSDGTSSRFDAVVGADGYASTVRRYANPESAPSYAGYVVWSGSYPESRVREVSLLRELDPDKASVTAAFRGGHMIVYFVPDSSDEPGQRRINWGIYTTTPPPLDAEHPDSLPPGQMTDELYSFLEEHLELLPPFVAALARYSRRQEVFIQTIYGQVVSNYSKGRVTLVGDAGSVTRPHTASGATQAFQDALALQAAIASGKIWESTLRAYSDERTESDNSIVALGQRIGHAQVVDTPDWLSMTVADFEAWTKEVLHGEKLYLHGDASLDSGRR